MMRKSMPLTLVACFFVFLTGCWTAGWKLEYGKPAAQFRQEDLSKLNSGHLGKKITLKGTLHGIDDHDPSNVWIQLDNNIRCNCGQFQEMVRSHEIGDVVFVDGVLFSHDDDGTILSPAILRDPTAPFAPL